MFAVTGRTPPSSPALSFLRFTGANNTSSDTTTSSENSSEECTSPWEADAPVPDSAVPAWSAFEYVMHTADPVRDQIVRRLGISVLKLATLSTSMKKTMQRPEVKALVNRSMPDELRRLRRNWAWDIGLGLHELFVTCGRFKMLSVREVKQLLLINNYLSACAYFPSLESSSPQEPLGLNRRSFAKLGLLRPEHDKDQYLREFWVYHTVFQMGLITGLVDYDEWISYVDLVLRRKPLGGFWQKFFEGLPASLETTWDDLHFLEQRDQRNGDRKARGLPMQYPWKLDTIRRERPCTADNYVLACIVRARAKGDPAVLRCMKQYPPVPSDDTLAALATAPPSSRSLTATPAQAVSQMALQHFPYTAPFRPAGLGGSESTPLLSNRGSRTPRRTDLCPFCQIL